MRQTVTFKKIRLLMILFFGNLISSSGATTTPTSCEDLKARYGLSSTPEIPCEFKFEIFREKDPRLTGLEISGYDPHVFNGKQILVGRRKS